jgi:hypothetical protein
MHTSALLFTVLSVLKFSTAVPVTDVNSVDVIPAKLVSVQITGDNFTATVAAPENPTLAGADATLADATLTDADATLADADATLADATLTDADATLADADATLADATLADATLADADLETVAPADFTKAQSIAAGGNPAAAKQMVVGASLSGGLSSLFPIPAFGDSCEAAVARRILAEVEGDVEQTINNDVNNPAFLNAQIAAISTLLNAQVGAAVILNQALANTLLASFQTALSAVDMNLAAQLIRDVRQDFRRVGDLEGRFERCRLNALLAQTPAASSTSASPTVTVTVTAPAATADPASAPTVFVISGGPDIQYGGNPHNDIEFLNIISGFDGFAKTE